MNIDIRGAYAKYQVIWFTICPLFTVIMHSRTAFSDHTMKNPDKLLWIHMFSGEHKKTDPFGPAYFRKEIPL